MFNNELRKHRAKLKFNFLIDCNLRAWENRNLITTMCDNLSAFWSMVQFKLFFDRLLWWGDWWGWAFYKISMIKFQRGFPKYYFLLLCEKKKFQGSKNRELQMIKKRKNANFVISNSSRVTKRQRFYFSLISFFISFDQSKKKLKLEYLFVSRGKAGIYRCSIQSNLENFPKEV